MNKKNLTQTLKEHRESIMSIAGVVGMGEGEQSGEPCITVLVVEKTPELLAQIPSMVEGYTVKVEESGKITPRNL